MIICERSENCRFADCTMAEISSANSKCVFGTPKSFTEASHRLINIVTDTVSGKMVTSVFGSGGSLPSFLPCLRFIAAYSCSLALISRSRSMKGRIKVRMMYLANDFPLDCSPSTMTCKTMAERSPSLSYTYCRRTRVRYTLSILAATTSTGNLSSAGAVCIHSLMPEG